MRNRHMCLKKPSSLSSQAAAGSSRRDACRADFSRVFGGSRRLLRLEWHGRMVQKNAHLAVVAALVPKSVLDCGGTSEVVHAHGKGDLALDFDLVVVIHAISP